MNKRGFEFSFAWLFAIIVGAVVIFLAIYASTSLIGNSRYETDTKIAAQLESVLNPVGTNLEEAKFSTIGFPDTTRVFNRCSATGLFGTQSISTSVRSGIGKEWLPPGGEISNKDKYVFSKSLLEGQEMGIFVKPLELPYKVSDMIFIYSGEYCFINPPSEIEEEIEALGLVGINVTARIEDCSAESEKVCFTAFNRDCDKRVGEREIDGVYYEEDFVYGAIFSDPEVYECQLKRLMKRDRELAKLYGEKSELLAGEGCSSLETELGAFSALLQEYQGSEDLAAVKGNADELEEKNEKLTCKLF